MAGPTHPAPQLHLLDSVGYITPSMAGDVIVTGSHGGTSAARYALMGQPRLAAFNDAGGGRDHAGTAGLALLQAEGIAAFTVSHTSARIGEAQSTYQDGIVTHTNAAAAALGIHPGMTCQQAVSRVMT